MFDFLNDEHLSGAAKCKKKVLKGIENGEFENTDLTPEEVEKAFTTVQPLMTYACRRGIRYGTVATLTGIALYKCAEKAAPYIRDAVKKMLSK